MTNKVFIYHKDCLDGLGAKYAGWKALGSTTQFHAANYGDSPPDFEPGSEVYIADFSYPKNVLLSLQAKSSKIQVLDHHKTAQQDLADLPFAKFDMDKSGAVLAWEYFFPGAPIPDLLLHIQDRDLWKWELENSKPILEGLTLSSPGVEVWDYLDLEDLKSKGETTLKFKQSLVKSATELGRIQIVSILGYKLGAVNTTNFTSEVGESIYQNPDLNVDGALMYSILPSGEALLSFRSDKSGQTDVSVLAKHFGGGGHKAASGAKVPLSVLVSILTT